METDGCDRFSAYRRGHSTAHQTPSFRPIVYAIIRSACHRTARSVLVTRAASWIERILPDNRLGIGQVQNKRIPYLDPLGVAMGENRSKVFRGWVQVSVTSIHDLVEATPAEGEENVFHAEVMRDDDFTTPRAKRAIAYQLCELARQREFVESPSYNAAAA